MQLVRLFRPLFIAAFAIGLQAQATKGQELSLERGLSVDLSWDLFRQVISDNDCNEVELRQACKVALDIATSTALELGANIELATANEWSHGSFLMRIASIEQQVPKVEHLGYLRLQTIRAFLSTLDPYASVHLAADSTGASTRTPYIGLGLRLTDSENGLEVKDVYLNSPADKAGLFASDRITSVSAEGTPGRAVASLTELRMLESSISSDQKFRFQLLSSTGEHREIVLERAVIEVPNIELHLGANSETGVLKIRSFNDDSLCDQAEAFLGQVTQAQVNQLVIDLRGNPGGDLRTATCLASLFIGPQPIYGTVSVASRIPAIKRLYVFEQQNSNQNSSHVGIHWRVGTESKAFDGRVSLVVDQDTASSAEIFAAALKHHIGAPIIGHRTFGKFVAQRFRTLPRNTNLILGWTGELVFQPDGTSLNQIGLIPDIALSNRQIDACMKDYRNNPDVLRDICDWQPY